MIFDFPNISPVRQIQKTMVEMRKRLDMSQNALDDFLGLAKGTVWRYENTRDKNNQSTPYGNCSANNLAEYYEKLKKAYDEKFEATNRIM